MINIYKHKNILLFYEFINDVNELTVTSEEEYDNIPEEFLDPLYNTLIENQYYYHHLEIVLISML